MVMRQQPLRISKRADTMTLDFGGNSVVRVDLNAVKLTDQQRAIITKLARAKPTFTLDECPGDDCPSAQRLSAADFRQIRHLKASLGTGGELRAIICHFCIKCIKLPDR